MGRPKKGEPPPGRLPTMVNVKCSAEWREWLDDAAARAGVSSAEFLATAAAARAKRLGCGPMPDRLPEGARPPARRKGAK